MPRARTSKHSTPQQTAVHFNGSGCLSIYSLPVLGVLLISYLLTAFAYNRSASIPIHSRSDAPQISAIFTPEIRHWEQDILRWASASSLDPNLVATIMQIESCGNPFAKSSAGAMGLFQVMPFHFQKGEDPYDPNTNALRGLSYLAQSLESSNGNARLALAGYNGGISIISRSERAWPAETVRYVYYGALIYGDAIHRDRTSDALREWYKKYGENLCKDASQTLGIEQQQIRD